MSKPRLACPLCNRWQGPTVQECGLCGGRFCAKHITWSDDLGMFVDDRCLRQHYGLKRAAPLPKTAEASA